MNGHGKSKADHHAAGICFHRLMNECSNLSEGFDLGQPPIHILAGEPENRAIQIHVIASRELRIETRAKLEECRDPAMRNGSSAAGRHDSCADLEQRALPGAVFSEDTESFAAADIESHIA